MSVVGRTVVGFVLLAPVVAAKPRATEPRLDADMTTSPTSVPGASFWPFSYAQQAAGEDIVTAAAAVAAGATGRRSAEAEDTRMAMSFIVQ